jgi:hypothetical protein
MKQLFSGALGLCALSVAANANILAPRGALQTPEPALMALIGSALIGLGLLSRRIQRQK